MHFIALRSLNTTLLDCILYPTHFLHFTRLCRSEHPWERVSGIQYIKGTLCTPGMYAVQSFAKQMCMSAIDVPLKAGRACFALFQQNLFPQRKLSQRSSLKIAGHLQGPAITVDDCNVIVQWSNNRQQSDVGDVKDLDVALASLLRRCGAL